MARAVLSAVVVLLSGYAGISSPSAVTLPVQPQVCEQLRNKANAGNELTSEEKSTYVLCIQQIPDPKRSWPPPIIIQNPPSPLNPLDRVVNPPGGMA
jgi:hypothetical protein